MTLLSVNLNKVALVRNVREVSAFVKGETDVALNIEGNPFPELVELYTESYARSFGSERFAPELERFARAAARACELGLGVNAGHDLTLENLGAFCRAVPHVLEVSIGHALVAHALTVGLGRAVRDYLQVLGSTAEPCAA